MARRVFWWLRVCLILAKLDRPRGGGLSDILKQLADIAHSQQPLMTKTDKKHKEMLTKIDHYMDIGIM